MINKNINDWIAFRAYCLRTNKIYDVYNICSADGSADLYDIETGRPAQIDRHELINENDEPDVIYLRKTALKDKKGNAIYDGDLLSNGVSILAVHWDCMNGRFNIGGIYSQDIMLDYEVVGNCNIKR